MILPQQIQRCDAEIARCRVTEEYPAYLLALAEVDWRAEKRLIEKEMSTNHVVSTVFHGKIEQDPEVYQHCRVPNLNDWSKQPMQSGNQSTITTNKPCLIVGCQVKTVARGLCDKHYRQAKTQGTLSLIPLRGRQASPKRVCSIVGCTAIYSCKGFCNRHYEHWRITGSSKYKHPQGTPLERFWHHVTKRGPEDCWEWSITRKLHGYGRLDLSDKTHIPAHRFSYEIHKGNIPLGMIVRHLCDNPACVNPAHLAVGTQLDNMQDRLKAGRYLRGERNPNVKFSDDVVAQVRLARGSQREIGKRFEMTQSHVGRIMSGKLRIS